MSYYDNLKRCSCEVIAKLLMLSHTNGRSVAKGTLFMILIPLHEYLRDIRVIVGLLNAGLQNAATFA